QRKVGKACTRYSAAHVPRVTRIGPFESLVPGRVGRLQPEKARVLDIEADCEVVLSPVLRDVVDELNHVLFFIGRLVARDANSEVGSAAVEVKVRETAEGGAEWDAAQTILRRNVDLRPCRDRKSTRLN